MVTADKIAFSQTGIVVRRGSVGNTIEKFAIKAQARLHQTSQSRWAGLSYRPRRTPYCFGAGSP